MKICPQCNEEVEDSFEICWNCNYSFTENRVIEPEEMPFGNRSLECTHCHVKLVFSGNYKFHEGTRLGVLGNIFEAFVNRESFDIYVCPKCGKVEFYTPLDE